MDFEQALKDTLGEEMKVSSLLCTQVWSALANVVWVHEEYGEYTCSFREAGGLICKIINGGNYMDWYGSGPYERVSYMIHEAMVAKGWMPHRWIDERVEEDELVAGDPIDPCCDCGKEAKWMYAPAYEGDDNPFCCDELCT